MRARVSGVPAGPGCRGGLRGSRSSDLSASPWSPTLTSASWPGLTPAGTLPTPLRAVSFLLWGLGQVHT